jgi:branched-subunit amino acid transport protein AzlD
MPDLTSTQLVGLALIVLATLVLIFYPKRPDDVDNWKYGMHEILTVLTVLLLFFGFEYLLFGSMTLSLKESAVAFIISMAWLAGAGFIRRKRHSKAGKQQSAG